MKFAAVSVPQNEKKFVVLVLAGRMMKPKLSLPELQAWTRSVMSKDNDPEDDGDSVTTAALM